MNYTALSTRYWLGVYYLVNIKAKLSYRAKLCDTAIAEIKL